METRQLRVRLGKDDLSFLSRLANESQLQQIDIATMILHAGIEAMKKSPQGVQFPLRLSLPACPHVKEI